MPEAQTGDCFEVAANIISMFTMPFLLGDGEKAALIRLNKISLNQSDLLLIHGWVTRPHDQRQHTHAWIEIPKLALVLDYSNGNRALVRKHDYYEIGAVGNTKEYPHQEVRRNLCEYDNYGPWDEMFDELGESK